jgi:hypothetical protein
LCSQAGPVGALDAHGVQAVGGRETSRLGNAFLLRSLDGSEEHNSGTGLVGSAARNEKLEISTGSAQGAQFFSQSAGTIRDLASPHIYFLDCIRHAYTSLKISLTLRFLHTKKPVAPQANIAKVTGLFSFLFQGLLFIHHASRRCVMLAKDEVGCCVI